jgi:hypothetical protein
VRFARASIAIAATASGLALLAPAAGAQVPAIELPAIPKAVPMPANPPAAVIPQQYHAVEAVVEKALPATPAAPPAAAPVAPVAPKPAAKPEYHPKPAQYHSEPPADVTVTQDEPQNLNVSIRINSPGDDGPVVQTNNAGGNVGTNIVQAPAPKPAALAPAPTPVASGEPDSWTWVWTSACFGGAGGGPGASTASVGPTWNWQWSCEQDDPLAGLPSPDGLLGVVPGGVPVSGDVMPGGVPVVGDRPEGASAPGPRARPRSEPAAHAPPARRPPTIAPLVAAAPVVAAAARPAAAVAARAGHAVRAAAKASAARAVRSGSNLFLPEGAGGPSAGAATGLGVAMSLLLGTWTAVLVCALALVLPRIWRRWWSGPPASSPAPRASRLERPG